MGNRYYKNLLEFKKQGKVEIVSVVDRDKTKLSKLDEKIASTDLVKELESKRPNIVIVSTNTATHMDVIETILDNQKENLPYLLIEKPIVEKLEDVCILENDLTNLGYGIEIPITFDYLIRQSQAVKSAIEYINKENLKIKSFDVIWQKKREGKRPSAGVHIDDITHSIDTIIRYILPSTGRNEKDISIIESNYKRNSSIVDMALQRKLYGSDKSRLKPIAEVYYHLVYGNTIKIKGFSSYIKEPLKREISISFEGINSHSIKMSFDQDEEGTKKEKDIIQISKNHEIIYSEEFNMKKNKKLFYVLKSFFDYIETNKKPDDLASIDDAIFDLKVTHALVTKNNIQ